MKSKGGGGPVPTTFKIGAARLLMYIKKPSHNHYLFICYIFKKSSHNMYLLFLCLILESDNIKMKRQGGDSPIF
jgi:hypothetical protein